jgi:hypothetical protein
MEQEFQLKYFGKFTLFEMAVMTAEDRSWHINRIKEQIDRENKANKSDVKGYGNNKFT